MMQWKRLRLRTDFFQRGLMMNLSDRTCEIVLLCDLGGNILRIIEDNPSIGAKIAPGKPFTALVDSGSIEKANNFLEELRMNKAAFDWELNVTLGDRPVSLHFAGGAVDNHILIIGAESRYGIARLYEELMRKNNKQADTLPASMRGYFQARASTDLDSNLYDELTRLNNELTNLQRELAKKNKELERLNEQKDRFLGIAAHDLRNPLSVIMMYSAFLLEDDPHALNEEQSEIVSIISSSSKFMLQLINNLLDLSVIETGKLSLDLQEGDLISLIQYNISVNSILAEQKRIKLVLAHQDELPVMRFDPPKIEQVLNNLIANAIKFSHPNSTIEIGVSRKDSEATISVKDEGQGIPANELDKLFKPFAKISVKGTGGEKGTGLGLAIVKNIVLGHQGRIWVESEVGKGTTFYVALPF
jgi:two-component system, OmpR family, sensor kinase